MDWLAVFVIVAIVGQLTLPIWGGWLRRRAHLRARRDVARLLEAAADRQFTKTQQWENKLDGTTQQGQKHD